jgi:uncharacterized protein
MFGTAKTLPLLKISPKITAVDLGLVIADSLIISDLHLGYEDSMKKSGIYIPPFQFKETVKRIENILAETDIKEIVINGDLKHDFSPTKKSTQELQKFLGWLSRKAKLVLIKGNHDKSIKGDLLESYTIGDILIVHGDIIPKISPAIKTIIIGHEHPAVGITDNSRTEIYKCFLKGRYKNKTLIVQPSFNLVTEGSNVLAEKGLTPFLGDDILNFDVFIVGKSAIYDFGTVYQIMQRNGQNNLSKKPLN